MCDWSQVWGLLSLWLIVFRYIWEIKEAFGLLRYIYLHGLLKKLMERTRKKSFSSPVYSNVLISKDCPLNLRRLIKHTCIDLLIICYLCGSHTYIIRDYKSFNSRVNAELALLLYVCVAHTYQPNPHKLRWQSLEIRTLTTDTWWETLLPSSLHQFF